MPEKKDSLHPLAVVGLSLKFPGEAVDAQTFWSMMVERRCAAMEFPPDRLNIDAHYHPDSNRLDSLSARGGHFMKHDLSMFDAPFFSITAAEAEAMDPQQRLVLETSYRALENAGITIDQVSGSKTCVFTGSFGHDYQILQNKDPQTLPKFHATGTSMNMLSNRVSWFFNLTGPSATVDTACSSSLMAIDLACQSIWSGDSTIGMAIGSNAILAVETSLSLDNLGLLSPSGRSYSFDRRANGYGRGEGVGVLIIKPVDDAIRHGDTIRAVIRASASNQDGRTPGITLPSMEMQQALIRSTYRKGGLDMAVTRYFEAHGTGTAVGDPIETKAIGSIFRPYRTNQDPLFIGSVKSAIGHLEGAAGVAGVIKAILALEKGVIPPNSTNYEILNPRIDNDFLHIKIPMEPVPWPTDGLRRASVSSFGFGGSNSHIVLDDAYNFLRLRGLQGNHNTVARPQLGLGPGGQSHGSICSNGCQDKKIAKLLVWSTADEKGIGRVQESWKRFFSNAASPNQIPNLDELSYTLGARRTHLPWRWFVIARSSDDWSLLPDKFTLASRALTSPNLAFVFSGQGSQWYAMGRELLVAYPIFYESIEAAGLYLQSLGCSWSILDELQRPESESLVNQPEYSQTMTTALQMALVDLLRSWNIIPRVVVGHSSGEIAAAYSAQAISQTSAWKIAFYRGKLSGKLEAQFSRRGTMLAVALSPGDVDPYLKNIKEQYCNDWINIACVNSPRSVTVSGDEALIDCLKGQLDSANVFSRKLKVGVAYHSAQMQKIAEEYQAALSDLGGPRCYDRTSHRTNHPQMVSSITGTWIDGAQLAKPDYWVQNLVSPVLFADALSRLCSGSADAPKKLDRSHLRSLPIHHLLEVGPHSVMQGACKDILKAISKDKSTSYLSMLVRNVSAVDTALTMAGHLHSAGYPVNLTRVNLHSHSQPRSLPHLPEYPFDHSKSYWHESQLSKGHRLRKFGRNDLLGVPDANWNPLEARWRHFISLAEMPWVKDHKVNDTIVYPGMGMLVMAIEAAKQMAEPDKKIAGFNIEDAAFSAPIRVPSSASGVETGFYMRPLLSADSRSTGSFEFRLCAYENQTWTQNCTGRIHIVYIQKVSNKDEEMARELLDTRVSTYTAVQHAAITPVRDEAIYEYTSRCGLGYGESFQLVNSLAWHRGDGNQVTCKVRRVCEGAETIHPTTLDAIIQSAIWTMTESGTKMVPTMVPTGVEKLWICHDGLAQLSPDILKVHALRSNDIHAGASLDIRVYDEDLQQILVKVSGFRHSVVSAAVGDGNEIPTSSSQKRLCHHLEWKPDLGLLTTEEIADICAEKVKCDQTGPGADFFTELEFVLTARILQTLRSLSSSEPTQPHLRKYIDWMREQKRLYDEGQVQYAFEPWKSRLDNKDYIQQAEQRVLHTNKQGNLAVSVARNLPLFLAGELDPLAFLFQGDQMKEYYLELVADSDGRKGLNTYLDLLAHRNPNMHIIEIGAGTGSMTNFMLRYLGRGDGSSSDDRRYARWDYTDISRSFFREAQDGFREEAELMRFRTLDIEQDPEAQGFDCGTYDVVVAAAVLHATADLRRTLTNVRKLLKRGGKLIFFEATETRLIRTPIIFGLLEGWWLSSEPYRQFSPLVDIKQWHKLLQQTGFSGLDVALPDYEDLQCREYSYLISSAVQDEPAQQSLGSIEIFYDASDPEQTGFANSLAPVCQSLTSSRVNCVPINEEVQESLSDTSSLRLFLLELWQPVLSDMQVELFEKLKRLLCSAADILWISSGGSALSRKPHLKLADGLTRVLTAEDDRKSCYLLSLEGTSSADHQRAQIIKLVKLLLSTDRSCQDTEYVEQQGLLHIGRLVTSTWLNDQIATRTTKQQKMQCFTAATIPLQLDAISSGLVTGFKFVEDKTAERPLEPDEIEVKVKCVGLNFRDVLIAVGQLHFPHMGFECSGVVVRTGGACEKFEVGDSVIALCTNCFANFIRLKESSAIAKIWPGLSFAQAAAIPVNFATAYIALHDIARMQPGESILIHSGAGGTGQAAIQLAQNLGVTVYATVGSDEKRTFLMDTYGIPDSHIFSSRSTLFASVLKYRTGGRGVDVVLNSLAGESLTASWDCIAPYGRFLELGKKDILANNSLSMGQFQHNVSFSAIDLASMMEDRPGVCATALSIVMKMVGEGKLRPAHPLHLFGIGEVENAFRFMQGGKHIGKVVVEMRETDEVTAVLNTRHTTSLDPEATYIISGGLGGLGRNIAVWLADRGARCLLLLSRSGCEAPEAQQLVHELGYRSVRVLTPSCDVANAECLQTVLEACRLQGIPPIKGCVQAAMVLRDGLFEAMPYASWTESLAPKVQGSWNLHQQLPAGMDFFIMLASICGISGNKGQANYAAGNTFQDALAAHRVARGEKATSLDLGLIGFTGAVVDDVQLHKRFLLDEHGPFTPITESEIHALLDIYCTSNPPTDLPSQTTVRITPNLDKLSASEADALLKKPMFRQLFQQNQSTRSSSEVTVEGTTSVATLLTQADTVAEANESVIQALLTRLSKALSISMAELDVDKPLHQYGVDSLVAVELRSWFSKEMQADIGVFDILGSATVTSVARLATSKTRLARKWVDQ